MKRIQPICEIKEFAIRQSQFIRMRIYIMVLMSNYKEGSCLHTKLTACNSTYTNIHAYATPKSKWLKAQSGRLQHFSFLNDDIQEIAFPLCTKWPLQKKKKEKIDPTRFAFAFHRGRKWEPRWVYEDKNFQNRVESPRGNKNPKSQILKTRQKNNKHKETSQKNNGEQWWGRAKASKEK
ncbi:hypothetical protein RUM43_012301 [Polyplax serrata]|uniref:Uncharacterized protein n=1 Tax=Polyplax serrata TaxID=468196 RepID=A0AAN8S359_POLSC